MQKIFENISIWIIVLPFIIGLLYYKKLNIDSRIIFGLVVIGLIPQLLSAFTFTTKVIGLNFRELIVFTYNIYTVIEAIVLSYFFSRYIQIRRLKIIYKSSVCLNIVIMLFYFVQLGFCKKYIGTLTVLNGLFYVFYILLNVCQIAVYNVNALSQKKNLRYFYVAILQYVTISTTIFALEEIRRQSELIHSLWVFQSIGNILLYVLIACGFMIDMHSYSVNPDKTYCNE